MIDLTSEGERFVLRHSGMCPDHNVDPTPSPADLSALRIVERAKDADRLGRRLTDEVAKNALLRVAMTEALTMAEGHPPRVRLPIVLAALKSALDLETELAARWVAADQPEGSDIQAEAAGYREALVKIAQRLRGVGDIGDCMQDCMDFALAALHPKAPIP